jgi:sensor histidine kinase YesM
MHPILAQRSRLFLYLAVWVAFGALLAAVIAFRGDASLPWALAFAIPLGVLLGMQSLSCWYLVKILPAGEAPLSRLAGTWAGAGSLMLTIWVSVSLGWAWVLRTWGGFTGVSSMLTPLMLFAGIVGLAVAVLAHYMVAAFERSRQAEHRALELRVLAREAELKFLRGQLDPHFLFNALNSVAALIGSDAQAARRMCFLVADFFRRSVRLGTQESIALADELALAETFLAIEEIRFGARLRKRIEIEDGIGNLAVPPLVLQPLVENAVHHGIAHLLEGGEVAIAARRRGALLELSVDNPCDPDRPASQGTGVGLGNVRARIQSLFENRARMAVEAAPEHFRVQILLPAVAQESSACAS